MPTVREIMTPNFRTVERNLSVSEVAGIFEAEKIGGAPLVDGDGNIVGLVSKSDIVHFEFVGGIPSRPESRRLRAPGFSRSTPRVRSRTRRERCSKSTCTG